MAEFSFGGWERYGAIGRADRYVIAYGSNLDLERMESRCPDCEVAGTSVMPGFRLLFKKSMTGFYATIEQDANCYVPVVIYKVTAEDEAMLDRYEGCPRFYYKRQFLLPIRKLNGKRMRERKCCAAYIMHEYRELGAPGFDYYHLLDSGYDNWEFDKAVLHKALADSMGTKKAEKFLKQYGSARRRFPSD